LLKTFLIPFIILSVGCDWALLGGVSGFSLNSITAISATKVPIIAYQNNE
jgi:hypothetical protein